MPASEPFNTRSCNTGITTTSALVADVDHTTRLTNRVRYSRTRFLSAHHHSPFGYLIRANLRRRIKTGDGGIAGRPKRTGALKAGPSRYAIGSPHSPVTNRLTFSDTAPR